MLKGRFKDRNVIVVLVLALVGLIFFIISEKFCEGLAKNILNQISLAILISGILGMINEYCLKTNLIELVLEKVDMKSDLDSTGIEAIYSNITEINYKSYYKKARRNIDIVHIYGRTWTTNHIDEIMEKAKSVNCKVRVVLVSPDSPFVGALEKHYDYDEGKLKSLIQEVSNIWRTKQEKLDEIKKASKKKSKNVGNIELYYHKGQPTNSMYRIDNRIVVVQTKTTHEKTTMLPAMIFRKTENENGYFKIYQKEIEQLIKESEKVNLSRG